MRRIAPICREDDGTRSETADDRQHAVGAAVRAGVGAAASAGVLVVSFVASKRFHADDEVIGEATIPVATLLDQRAAGKKLFQPRFCASAVFTLAMWGLFLFSVRLVSNDTEIMSFDPYKILNIERGIEDAEIKKAYRRMSLPVCGRSPRARDGGLA